MIPKYQPQSLPPDVSEALFGHVGLLSGLRNVEEAALFLRRSCLATLWGGTELPSLQEAFAGVAVARPTLASPGVGMAWVWAKSLVESQEFILVKLFRRRATFVARPLWPTLLELSPKDPASFTGAGELSTAARAITKFLYEHGPASTLELQEALPPRFPILPRSLKKGLRELEEKLVVYPQLLGDHQSGKDVNTWELLRRGLQTRDSPSSRRSERPSEPETPAAAASLLREAIRAAGVVDLRESSRWFPRWKLQLREALGAMVTAAELQVLDARRPDLLASPDLARHGAPPLTAVSG